jgi:hypothetical protein
MRTVLFVILIGVAIQAHSQQKISVSLRELSVLTSNNQCRPGAFYECEWVGITPEGKKAIQKSIETGTKVKIPFTINGTKFDVWGKVETYDGTSVKLKSGGANVEVFTF